MESTILEYTQQQRALGISRRTPKAPAVCSSPREAWAQSTAHPLCLPLGTATCSGSCLTGKKGGKERGKEAGGGICYPIALKSCLAVQTGTI